MARRASQVRFLNRVVAPIVLGLLFLAFVLDALFPADDPAAVGVYNGLTIISLILTVGFAGLLVEALYSRRENWRLYAILLGTVVGIWIVGAVQHVYLPRPQLSWAPHAQSLGAVAHFFWRATNRWMERS